MNFPQLMIKILKMRLNCYVVQILSIKYLKIGSFQPVLSAKFEKQFSKINNKIKVMSLLFFVFSYIFIHTA